MRSTDQQKINNHIKTKTIWNFIKYTQTKTSHAQEKKNKQKYLKKVGAQSNRRHDSKTPKIKWREKKKTQKSFISALDLAFHFTTISAAN